MDWHAEQVEKDREKTAAARIAEPKSADKAPDHRGPGTRLDKPLKKPLDGATDV
jgi:hypothetical protein